MENKDILIQGIIKSVHEYDSGDGVYVGHEPLSYQLDHISRKNVSVSFYISETEKTLDELKENLILQISGALWADYGDRYSDYTGYLWTDDKLRIGEHNLLDDIQQHEGKYATILVTIND